MSKRWSKLQTRLYGLMDPSIRFQIHCVLYEIGYHGSKLPRYFITVDKEITFDYPKEFGTTSKYYPWDSDVSKISNVIEEYIQCPDGGLMNPFENDKWGITDIFRVCDRRIGKRRLQELRNAVNSDALLRIIDRRLGE